MRIRQAHDDATFDIGLFNHRAQAADARHRLIVVSTGFGGTDCVELGKFGFGYLIKLLHGFEAVGIDGDEAHELGHFSPELIDKLFAGF